MLEKPSGILASLQQTMPDTGDLIDKVAAAVQEFDPSGGVMLVRIAPCTDQEIRVIRIPQH
jgi:hypothetical protein